MTPTHLQFNVTSSALRLKIYKVSAIWLSPADPPQNVQIAWPIA